MRSGSVPSDWQFTGQEQDGTGLVYLHARYYDPATGQFLSPDTIVPDPSDVFSHNRYMYARGNPLRHNDPTGHCATLANGDPDWDGEENYACWQAAYSIFGMGSSSHTSFADEWQISPQQWLTSIATQPFATTEYLTPFAERYFDQFQIGVGLNQPTFANNPYPPFEGSPQWLSNAMDAVRHPCSTWDCVALGLSAASLGVSIAQTAATACTAVTGPACGSAAGYLTIVDISLNTASIVKEGADYAHGSASAADLAVSLADASKPALKSALGAASVTPAVGIFTDFGMLVWELADPLVPNERWGGSRGAR